MRIATLSIGDELLAGEVVDSNSTWIASRLHQEGGRILQHLTVGDSEQSIADAIHFLVGQYQLVIATGGLGPTVDDVTADGVAMAIAAPLTINAQALTHIRQVTEKLGKNSFQLNEKQALFPAGADLVPNPTGTACGFRIEFKGCCFFFLPGVPSEMKRMLDDTIVPWLQRHHRQKTSLQTKVFKVFGPSEAEVADMLKNSVEAGTGISLAYGVEFPEILVKLRGAGCQTEELSHALDCAGQRIRQRLSDHIYAEGEETMDSVVARLCREKRVTISVAESCTGGLVAKRLTDVAGSSAYFQEGVVTYSNAAKERLLAVPSRLLEEQGAVSAGVAEAMANGMRALSGTDIALAVTGIAGPDGGSKDKPVGTVYIAASTVTGCWAERFNFSGSRDEIRIITAFTALDWLRKWLLSR